MSDDILGVIAIIIILATPTYILTKIIHKENDWKVAPRLEVQCKLLTERVDPSTQETRMVPVIATDGNFRMGFVSTGHDEQHITVWDCGHQGRIISHNEEIFRFARPVSTLIIASRGGELRTIGIKKE